VSIEPKNILIIGGSGGIGHALTDAALARFPDTQITATYHSTSQSTEHERLRWHKLDIRDHEAIESMADKFEELDWLINCAGALHLDGDGPEKNIRSVEPHMLLSSIQINTLPTLMLARYFSAVLRKSQKPILATVSAKVGSIEDNRLGGWYSYRISKAGLNMALKTLSIEWGRTHPAGCVVALHPGTNKTRLSEPFQAGVAPQNLFEPAYTAAHFLDRLISFGPEHSGKFWAWDGELLPW